MTKIRISLWCGTQNSASPQNSKKSVAEHDLAYLNVGKAIKSENGIISVIISKWNELFYIKMSKIKKMIDVIREKMFVTIFKICSITSNFNNKFYIYWNSDSVTKLYHSFTKLETLLVGSSLSCGLETKLRFSINRRCWAATGLKDKEWKTIRGFILLLLRSFQALIFMSLQQISPAIGIRRGAPLSVYVLRITCSNYLHS